MCAEIFKTMYMNSHNVMKNCYGLSNMPYRDTEIEHNAHIIPLIKFEYTSSKNGRNAKVYMRELTLILHNIMNIGTETCNNII